MIRLLELDSRKRLSLGDLAKHSLYSARVDDDGVITLTPVTPVAVEDWDALVHENRELRARCLSQKEEIIKLRNALKVEP